MVLVVETTSKLSKTDFGLKKTQPIMYSDASGSFLGRSPTHSTEAFRTRASAKSVAGTRAPRPQNSEAKVRGVRQSGPDHGLSEAGAPGFTQMSDLLELRQGKKGLPGVLKRHPVCMRICMRTLKSVCVNICVYPCVYAWARVCVCVCVYIYIYVCV